MSFKYDQDMPPHFCNSCSFSFLRQLNFNAGFLLKCKMFACINGASCFLFLIAGGQEGLPTVNELCAHWTVSEPVLMTRCHVLIVFGMNCLNRTEVTWVRTVYPNNRLLCLEGGAGWVWRRQAQHATNPITFIALKLCRDLPFPSVYL